MAMISMVTGLDHSISAPSDAIRSMNSGKLVAIIGAVVDGHGLFGRQAHDEEAHGDAVVEMGG